ncbi:hypothetical protein SDC9_142620 [bioreactor metagenome]|uniref:Uncharacterized protein n=1 Tax=bioreactor metagenome TaxID=1076179 RepID=A0A645E1N0_9ZZZZ
MIELRRLLTAHPAILKSDLAIVIMIQQLGIGGWIESAMKPGHASGTVIGNRIRTGIPPGGRSPDRLMRRHIGFRQNPSGGVGIVIGEKHNREFVPPLFPSGLEQIGTVDIFGRQKRRQLFLYDLRRCFSRKLSGFNNTVNR